MNFLNHVFLIPIVIKFPGYASAFTFSVKLKFPNFLIFFWINLNTWVLLNIVTNLPRELNIPTTRKNNNNTTRPEKKKMIICNNEWNRENNDWALVACTRSFLPGSFQFSRSPNAESRLFGSNSLIIANCTQRILASVLITASLSCFVTS